MRAIIYIGLISWILSTLVDVSNHAHWWSFVVDGLFILFFAHALGRELTGH